MPDREVSIGAVKSRGSWRPERSVCIADALELLLDRVEEDFDCPEPRVTEELLPFSTGLVALDRVCGGGLHSGIVTVLECPLPSHARSLLFSVARGTDVPTMLAVDDLEQGATWLLAGASGVPAKLIEQRELSERDWDAISARVGVLADQELVMTEARSAGGIEHLIREDRSMILIVDEPGRLGPVEDVLWWLTQVAEATGVACLTSVGDLSHLTGYLKSEMVNVTVVPHTMGGRATLVSTDCDDGFAVAHVQVAMLVGDAS